MSISVKQQRCDEFFAEISPRERRRLLVFFAYFTTEQIEEPALIRLKRLADRGPRGDDEENKMTKAVGK